VKAFSSILLVETRRFLEAQERILVKKQKTIDLLLRNEIAERKHREIMDAKNKLLEKYRKNADISESKTESRYSRLKRANESVKGFLPTMSDNG